MSSIRSSNRSSRSRETRTENKLMFLAAACFIDGTFHSLCAQPGIKEKWRDETATSADPHAPPTPPTPSDSSNSPELAALAHKHQDFIITGTSNSQNEQNEFHSLILWPLNITKWYEIKLADFYHFSVFPIEMLTWEREGGRCAAGGERNNSGMGNCANPGSKHV